MIHSVISFFYFLHFLLLGDVEAWQPYFFLLFSVTLPFLKHNTGEEGENEKGRREARRGEKSGMLSGSWRGRWWWWWVSIHLLLLHYVYAGNLPLNLLSWRVLLGSVCGLIEFLFHYLHVFSLLVHDNHPGLVSFTWFCILNPCWYLV